MRFNGWAASATIAIATSAVCCLIVAGYMYMSRPSVVNVSKGKKRSGVNENGSHKKKKLSLQSELQETGISHSSEKECAVKNDVPVCNDVSYAAKSADLLADTAKMVAMEFVDEITRDLESFVATDCESEFVYCGSASMSDALGGGSWMMPSAEEIELVEDHEDDSNVLKEETVRETESLDTIETKDEPSNDESSKANQDIKTEWEGQHDLSTEQNRSSVSDNFSTSLADQKSTTGSLDAKTSHASTVEDTKVRSNDKAAAKKTKGKKKNNKGKR